MSTIPTPPAPTATAYDIERRLRDGEHISYEEMEDSIDDLDFREVIRPIAYDDSCGWVLRDDAYREYEDERTE